MRRILGHHVATSWLVFGVLEASVMVAGCCAALYYRFSGSPSFANPVLSFATVLSFGVVALMHSGGLYDGEAALNLTRARRCIAAITAPIFALAVGTTGELAKLPLSKNGKAEEARALVEKLLKSNAAPDMAPQLKALLAQLGPSHR